MSEFASSQQPSPAAEISSLPRAPQIAAARPPRVLAVANQKGGVGKTTTAINLGTALAAIGEDVLIIDLDPQGNASTGLGIDRKSRSRSTYDVLAGEIALRDAIVPTAVPRLSLAPSTLDLTGFELEIGQSHDRALRLRNALAPLNVSAPEQTHYAYVLIDCPPSLNLLTVNAMAAANAILVPLQCEFFALEGLSQLLKTVESVREQLNPGLTIHGVVLTMYDSRNNLSGPGCRRRAPVHGQQSLRHHHPAQRARIGGAVLRQTGAGLRSQMQRQRSLSAARHRDHPAGKRIARGVKRQRDVTTAKLSVEQT